MITVERLLELGSQGGASALGVDRWDGIEVDLDHPSLAGIGPSEAPAALIFGSSADVFA